MTAAGPYVDRAGFLRIEVPSSSPERLLGEDRWERLDWIRHCLPNSRLRMARLAQSTGGFNITPDCIVDLTAQTYVRHGVSSFWVLDCLYNLAPVERVCRVIAETGAEVLPTIMFGDAPVLTDEFFADIVRHYVSWGTADGILVEDAPGILTPQRTPSLMKAIVDAKGDLPVELHCHSTTGMASANYMQALKQGVRILHTASRPLANGTSISGDRSHPGEPRLGWAHAPDRP